MADARLSVGTLALQTLGLGLTFCVAGPGLRDHGLDAQNHQLAFTCWTNEAGVRVQGLAEQDQGLYFRIRAAASGFRVDGVG